MEIALTGNAALLLRWNGMRWEPKRAVNSLPMRALEARISRLWPWRVSKLKNFFFQGN
jgi:hypothetical protein